jgi:hypothetical protein
MEQRVDEIVNGLLFLERSIIGVSNEPPLDFDENDDHDDVHPINITPDLIQKYRLDCPDWMSFKSNCKSAKKYCDRLNDFLLWRESSYAGDLRVTPDCMLTSLISYFDYARTLKGNSKSILYVNFHY